MYVERKGSGNDIYLGLHGWGADHHIFAPLDQFIPVHASFYSADLPGVSLSPPPRQWLVDEIVSQIVETISIIGNPKTTIVGHCGGAVFGLLAAIKAADSVERIIMIDPFAYLPRYFKLFINERFGSAAYQATFANSFGRWVTNKALSGRRKAGANLTASFRDADHTVARNYLKLFAEAEEIEIPPDLSVRIDLVSGEKSFSAVKRSVASLSKQLPMARIWSLGGAAHMPIEEATKELCGIIFEPENIGVVPA